MRPGGASCKHRRNRAGKPSKVNDAKDDELTYYEWCKFFEVLLEQESIISKTSQAHGATSDAAWPLMILSLVSTVHSWLSMLQGFSSSLPTRISYAIVSSLISSEFGRDIYGLSIADWGVNASATYELDAPSHAGQEAHGDSSKKQTVNTSNGSQAREINLKSLAPTDFAAVEACLEDTLSRISNSSGHPILSFRGRRGIYSLTLEDCFITVPAARLEKLWQDTDEDAASPGSNEFTCSVSLRSKFPTDYMDIEEALVSLAPGWVCPLRLIMTGTKNTYTLSVSGLTIALGEHRRRSYRAQASKTPINPEVSPGLDPEKHNESHSGPSSAAPTAKRGSTIRPETSDQRALFVPEETRVPSNETEEQQSQGAAERPARKRVPRQEGQSRFADFFQRRYQPPAQPEQPRSEGITAESGQSTHLQDSVSTHVPPPDGNDVHSRVSSWLPRPRASTVGEPPINAAGQPGPLTRYFEDREVTESPSCLTPGKSLFAGYVPEVWAPHFDEAIRAQHEADVPPCPASPEEVLQADQSQAAFTSEPSWSSRRPGQAAAQQAGLEDPFLGPAAPWIGPLPPRNFRDMDLRVLNDAFRANLEDAARRAAADAHILSPRPQYPARPEWIHTSDAAPSPARPAAGEGSPRQRRRGLSHFEERSGSPPNLPSEMWILQHPGEALYPGFAGRGLDRALPSREEAMQMGRRQVYFRERQHRGVIE